MNTNGTARVISSAQTGTVLTSLPNCPDPAVPGQHRPRSVEPENPGWAALCSFPPSMEAEQRFILWSICVKLPCCVVCVIKPSLTELEKKHVGSRK